jgi:hypothetical protein
MATAPLLQGTVPSEYRFLRRLGKKANQQGLQRFYGACSAVYLCELRGQPFVLKMMLNVFDVGTIDLEKEFQNEFAILRAFQQDAQRSPHVIEMLYTVAAPVPVGLPDFEVDVVFRSTQFVAFPFYSESLQQLISRRKQRGRLPYFSDEEVVQVVRGLFDAVKYLQLTRRWCRCFAVCSTRSSICSPSASCIGT